MRRPCIARSTRRSPQIFPTITRSLYPSLPVSLKAALLLHTQQELDKLKRALGDGFEGQMMFQPRARSPAAATAGPSVAPEDVSAPPTNAGNKYAGRKHLHPANFVLSPESPTCGHNDPRRDGHRSNGPSFSSLIRRRR